MGKPYDKPSDLVSHNRIDKVCISFPSGRETAFLVEEGYKAKSVAETLKEWVEEVMSEKTVDAEVVILSDGSVKFLYYDELKPLLDIGDVHVSRASHVDPERTAEGLKWFCDLSPVNGPKLGPFETRAEAIEEEVKWLSANYLTKQGE